MYATSQFTLMNEIIEEFLDHSNIDSLFGSKKTPLKAKAGQKTNRTRTGAQQKGAKKEKLQHQNKARQKIRKVTPVDQGLKMKHNLSDTDASDEPS